ncbi:MULTISPECIES: hypothetical protein [unclassified Streptomyces]|jgi:hypothetical protein|uniref:hypothetical protein n=1 Tax=unclassified Streptomyces TaxID=2593676 RepID=UPI000F4EDD5D|nr:MULTISPECIES: hypothetical protein [unclassified Streptomyces]MDH6451765.1 hypothetical protein [Streptomyces sp. SAI-119]MDH6497678.1 hypothetical protein [Streptomyces sp. SAI-149]QUC55636.1 hypothetical protein IOD14_01860 [Streptomyces sp. A2-16]GLP66182.1 hypothetical protein TUSST3_28020 [Streptomyces sp. TUS-ST3]
MRARTATALAVLILLAGSACTARPAPPPDDVIKAATRALTDDCLTRRGLTPRSGEQRVSDALFGTGKAELSLRLPSGYVVRTHTDGCLAAAQQRLYGDQDRWFRTSVVVNNLTPEAARTGRPLSEVRAAHRAEIAEWRRLRARALTTATALLEGGGTTPKGNQ